MMIDEEIFDEIQYLKPSTKHTICADCDLDDNKLIERLVRFYDPIEYGESNEEYDARINDEMSSYPLLGLIRCDSPLDKALTDYQKSGDHQLKLLQFGCWGHRGNPIYSPYKGFLTYDTNYDVVDVDLFKGIGNGSAKKQFINYINKNIAII